MVRLHFNIIHIYKLMICEFLLDTFNCQNMKKKNEINIPPRKCKHSSLHSHELMQLFTPK